MGFISSYVNMNIGSKVAVNFGRARETDCYRRCDRGDKSRPGDCGQPDGVLCDHDVRLRGGADARVAARLQAGGAANEAD